MTDPHCHPEGCPYFATLRLAPYFVTLGAEGPYGMTPERWDDKGPD